MRGIRACVRGAKLQENKGARVKGCNGVIEQGCKG